MNENKIITLGATFILGFAAGWLVSGQHWDVFLTSFIPSLATLVAAFYGAKYAFQFQKDKERKDNKSRNVVNGNNSIFALMRMANKLVVFQKQIINPIRTSPSRLLEMPPTNWKRTTLSYTLKNYIFYWNLMIVICWGR